MIEDVFMGFEDAVREPVVTHELPDVFDRVQFGYSGDRGGSITMEMSSGTAVIFMALLGALNTICTSGFSRANTKTYVK